MIPDALNRTTGEHPARVEARTVERQPPGAGGIDDEAGSETATSVSTSTSGASEYLSPQSVVVGTEERTRLTAGLLRLSPLSPLSPLKKEEIIENTW
jgi:hypothetical protein